MHYKKSSKFLSLILRHQPERIGIDLDKNGWVEIDTLLTALSKSQHSLTRTELESLVESNDKKRFTIDGNRIRANQGHSLSVELDLKPQQPPAILFHGTATKYLDSILKQGLLKRKRQHVHLSSELITAEKVGKRHGKLVILNVDASKMANDSIPFYLSANGVWLVDHVPAHYLSLAPTH